MVGIGASGPEDEGLGRDEVSFMVILGPPSSFSLFTFFSFFSCLVFSFSFFLSDLSFSFSLSFLSFFFFPFSFSFSFSFFSFLCSFFCQGRDKEVYVTTSRHHDRTIASV